MSDIAHTLNREAEAARTLLLNIRDVIGDDEQAKQDAIEGETNFKEACGSALSRLAEIDALSEAIAGQTKKLAARHERLQAQSEAIRAALGAAMETAGVARLRSEEHTSELQSH